jgi:hypothetical protein
MMIGRPGNSRIVSSDGLILAAGSSIYEEMRRISSPFSAYRAEKELAFAEITCYYVRN